jgi:hypothetical protein
VEVEPGYRRRLSHPHAPRYKVVERFNIRFDSQSARRYALIFEICNDLCGGQWMIFIRSWRIGALEALSGVLSQS